MDAKEARRRALSITGDKEKEQYEAIKTVIGITVFRGELFTRTYTTILPSVKRKLEEEGYEVEIQSDQRDGIVNVISW